MNKTTVVEALGRYSNQTFLLKRLNQIKALGCLPTNRRPAGRQPRIHKLDQRLSQVLRRQIVDDYQAGISTPQLAATYRLGKGTVLKILRDAGIQLQYRRLTPAQIREAAKLYETGLSLQRIADQLGCSAGTVHNQLRAAGVQMRKPWTRA